MLPYLYRLMQNLMFDDRLLCFILFVCFGVPRYMYVPLHPLRDAIHVIFAEKNI